MAPLTLSVMNVGTRKCMNTTEAAHRISPPKKNMAMPCIQTAEKKRIDGHRRQSRASMR